MLQYGVHLVHGNSVLLLYGHKLFGIDAFGWGGILFLSGPPPEVYPVPVPMPFPVTATQLIPYHRRARYVFLANGSLHEGSFVLLAKNAAEAHALAGALQDQTILVKYNPRDPKDSKVEEEKVLDKKVLQEGENPLNPRVW